MPSSPPRERTSGSLLAVPSRSCPHTCAIPSTCGLSLLPLLRHVFTEVQAITVGAAPAVYQTFSPELQLPGWDGGAVAPQGGGQLLHCPRARWG